MIMLSQHQTGVRDLWHYYCEIRVCLDFGGFVSVLVELRIKSVLRRSRESRAAAAIFGGIYDQLQ